MYKKQSLSEWEHNQWSIWPKGDFFQTKNDFIFLCFSGFWIFSSFLFNSFEIQVEKISFWSALIIYQINKLCISKKFSVPRRQINLLNLKSQYIYGIFYGIWVFGDQMKILLLQVYYNQIGGAENVFTVWWIHDVCEFLGKNV